jgi:hypothetical protein
VAVGQTLREECLRVQICHILKQKLANDSIIPMQRITYQNYKLPGQGRVQISESASGEAPHGVLGRSMVRMCLRVLRDSKQDDIQTAYVLKRVVAQFHLMRSVALNVLLDVQVGVLWVEIQHSKAIPQKYLYELIFCLPLLCVPPNSLLGFLFLLGGSQVA